MKKMFISLFVVLLIGIPTHAKAMSVNDAYRESLLALIEVLQKQIEVLRAELALKQSVTRPAIPTIQELMESQFYDGAYSGLYIVNGNVLTPVGGVKLTATHQALWNGFVAVAGKTFVHNEMQEFRVFSSRTSPYDAFVDLDPATGKWILGVNTYNFDISNDKVWEELNPLFVHEIGHIVVTDLMLEEFTNLFWDAYDMRHAERVANLSSSVSRDSLARNYFEDHESDFVSEYAATSPLEDAVESFTAFAMGYPSYGSGLRVEKIDFFEQFDNTLQLRAQIQAGI